MVTIPEHEEVWAKPMHGWDVWEGELLPGSRGYQGTRYLVVLEGPVPVVHILCTTFTYNSLPMIHPVPVRRDRPAFDENNVP